MPSSTCKNRSNNLRIIIAEDHKIVRQGLRMILESEPDMEVVAEAGTGVEAVRLAEELVPDLMLVDIMMPDMDGIEVIRLFAERRPDLPVLVLSMHGERQFILETLGAGAKGYLLKECAASELVAAIHNIVSGGVYLSQKVTGVILNEFVRNPPEQDHSSSAAKLSPREEEIIKLIANGSNTKEIAFTLGVSVKTVETHRGHLIRKLNVNSIAELVKYAVREGLVSP